MTSDENLELPATWLALSTARQDQIVGYMRDALKLLSADPEITRAAFKVLNEEMASIGLHFDPLSLEEYGEKISAREAAIRLIQSSSGSKIRRFE